MFKSRVSLIRAENAEPAMHRELAKLERRFGELPPCVLAAANSPRALEGLLALSGSLGWGRIDEGLADRIAVAVAAANDCTHLEEMHRCALRRDAGVSEEELDLAREGRSADPRYGAVLAFALELVERRGRVSEAAYEDVRAAGYSDAEIVEIIAHVALQIFGNYLDLALLPPDAERAPAQARGAKN